MPDDSPEYEHPEVEARDLDLDDMIQPPTSVRWLPEWDMEGEHPPGENTHIEDDTLYWHRDGFNVALRNREPTLWEADVTLPDEAGEYFPRKEDIQARPDPEYGYVETVELAAEGYATEAVTLVFKENYMPVYEINKWVRGVREQAAEMKATVDQFNTQ
ncbi:hypothetical protein [Halomarina oriensis]|uniref:Uncharacterized protein n=1 Tax=Halomarina oriensis TaxID=671145 RepID=A0A6B0GT16_9EURY|nr:hypothetical protein [Halomarina oriensis]MWG36497.1 hypothetical protein [Halomarina oriensis]